MSLKQEGLLTRIKITNILSRTDAFNEDGLLSNGLGVADFVRDDGSIDINRLASTVGPEAANRVEQSYLAQHEEFNPHWSKKTAEAQSRVVGNGTFTGRPKEIRRGPGRHSSK